MKEFKIKIPEVSDLQKYWEIIKFKVRGGFKCDTCSNLPNFRQVAFRSQAHNHLMIFENHTANQCANCTMIELNLHSKDVYIVHDCKCDWCAKIKPTAQWIRNSKIKSKVIFGSAYWNGHNICEDCMNLAYTNKGDDISSILVMKNGITYYKNELGILIRRNKWN